MTEARRPPGPPSQWTLLNIRSLRRDPLKFFTGLMREYGDVVRFSFGPRVVQVIAHPDGAQRVLQENNRNYDKQTRGMQKIRKLLGDGLLTSEGDFWLRQRRLAQPAFHKQKIAAFGKVMTDSTLDLQSRWRAAAKAGEIVDIDHDMMELTLRIAARTLFSSDVTEASQGISDALGIAMKYANKRAASLFDFVEKLPTSENRRVRAAEETLDAVVRRIIDERRKAGGGGDDLLGMFMGARDADTGESMSDQHLRDEVLTLLLAGHETTANALAWTWFLLSKHPDVRRKLDAELETVLAGRTPTFEDAPKLTYTRMIIDESLRLYPPAWTIARRAIEADVLAGYEVRKGTYTLVMPWLAHRHPDYWPNPEGFDPERFRPGVEHHRYAYFPFGGGPRLCIGNAFALLELTLLLPMLAQVARPELLPGALVEPEATITVRPRDGLRMRLRPA